VELILIRHAEPVRVADAGEPADPELSERGLRQAELLVPYLREEGVDALYCSPQQRARQTAAPSAAALGLEPVIRERVAEFDRHSPTYIPIEEMRASRDERFLAMLNDDYSLYGIDMVAFKRDVIDECEAIIAEHPGGRVAVVCHGGVINAYLCHVLGIDKFSFFAPDYTSLNRVAANRKGVRTVLRVNEVGHLRGHDLLVSTV